MILQAGGNAPVPSSTLTVRVTSAQAGDVSAFRLYQNGKVRGDGDMVFYGQKMSDDRSICQEAEGQITEFAVALPMLNADVQKVSFTITADAGRTVASLMPITIEVLGSSGQILQANVDPKGRTEAALILGELYRRNNEWKFRFVSQGFNGGLKPLAEHFGVNVADDQQPSPTPPPPPPPSRQDRSPPPTPPASNVVSLSKVSLTKEKPTISLAKKADYGEVRINLNWNRGGKTNWLGKRQSVDLDLGAYVKTADGRQHLIQALGGNFGSLVRSPFVELQGDDRTGGSADGEWIYVNGRHFQEIREIIFYCFIYEGVPDWGHTDGVVTMHIPEQPRIETRLTEGNQGMMCAIARLTNFAGEMRIERLNRYFDGHQDMDHAFGWGFRWTNSSK